jgi:hypothetical protein
VHWSVINLSETIFKEISSVISYLEYTQDTVLFYENGLAKIQGVEKTKQRTSQSQILLREWRYTCKIICAQATLCNA